MHARHLTVVKRQVLGPLSSVLGGVESVPGIIVSSILSIGSPSTQVSTSTQTTPRTSATTVTATSSVIPLIAPTASVKSTSSTSSATSTFPTTTTPTSSSVSTSAQVFTSVSGDATFTVTSVVMASSTSTAPAAPPRGFLQNKPLSGAVFALAGVVALVIVVVIATLTLRKSRRRRLQEDALSFDPDFTTGAFGGGNFARETSFEKHTVVNTGQALGSESSLIRQPNYTKTPTIAIPSQIVGHTELGFYGQTQYNQLHAGHSPLNNVQYNYGPPRSPNSISNGPWPTSPTMVTIDPHLSRVSPAPNHMASFTVRSNDRPENMPSRESGPLKQISPLPHRFGAENNPAMRGSINGDLGRTLKVANE